MKEIREGLKTYDTATFPSVSGGNVSTSWWNGGYHKPEEGKHIPYGFDNDILPSKQRISNRPTQNMEWIQHYENFNNGILNTKFYPWVNRDKQGRSLNYRKVRIEYNPNDFMKSYRIKVREREEVDPRQLTLLLSRLVHPKEWIRSVFVSPHRLNPSLFDIASTKRYDKFMTKQYMSIVKELRKGEKLYDAFNPYKRIPVTESDMRYTFVIQKYNTWTDPIRKRVQKIEGYALKVFPPYEGYAEYDFRTDSFNIDLDHFMQYYKTHKLYEIDMRFYPFTNKMPVSSGESIDMVVPKKGYTHSYLDEYFPELDENDFKPINKVVDTKYIDKWAESVESVIPLAYYNDFRKVHEWFISNDKLPLTISTKEYKNKKSSIGKMVEDYFASVGFPMEKRKDSY